MSPLLGKAGQTPGAVGRHRNGLKSNQQLLRYHQAAPKWRNDREARMSTSGSPVVVAVVGQHFDAGSDRSTNGL
jgi:hypothetical protein